ncbi:MAG TPA: TetR/AcrR family transcriptional regulator [Acidimicrobiia bacterium]|jgi:AcrR family transcriptional regulator
MAISEEDIRVRAGRPRDPACDAAILQATLDLFAEHGYGGVSMDGVAARAGVGKATIYRRYSSKAELVVEAVRCGVQLEDRLPDTGDLRADLISMMRPLLDRLRGNDAKVLITFAVERLREPELAEEFDRSVIGKKREHIRHLVRSAIQRGDLPADSDADLIAEAPGAFIWHHAIYNLPMDDALLGRIVDLVLPRPT